MQLRCFVYATMLFRLPGGRAREVFGRRFSDEPADFLYVQSGNSVKRLVRDRINIKERGGETLPLPCKPTRKRHTGKCAECVVSNNQGK